jgi:SAM-dependent methyltransferase
MAVTEPLCLDDALWDELDLGPNTRAFMKRMYADGLDRYTRRLRALSFVGGQRALDAGCGGGQWTLALGEICGEVWGVDVEDERLLACTRIAARVGAGNVHFKRCGLERLPFENASFDRVLCYSVLYQTHFEKSIAELGRVTRPAGLLYLSSNDVGRFLQQILSPSNASADFDPRAYGWRTLWNSIRGRREGLSMRSGGVVTPKSSVERLLRESGFDIVASGAEGMTGGASEAFMTGFYLGLPATYDVLARRA